MKFLILGGVLVLTAGCASRLESYWHVLPVSRADARVYVNTEPYWTITDCSEVPEACGFYEDHWSIQLLVIYPTAQTHDRHDPYRAVVEGWAVNCEEGYGWRGTTAYYREPRIAPSSYMGTGHSYMFLPAGKHEREVAKSSPEVEAVCALFKKQPPIKKILPPCEHDDCS